jgi:hypothetical protein
MARDPNKEYSVDAFRKLCEETVQNLPERAKDESVDWEERHELMLEQLLAKVHRYANSSSVKLGMQEMPRSLYLEEQIIHVLEFDWSLSYFKKRAIIHECVERAIGKKH